MLVSNSNIRSNREKLDFPSIFHMISKYKFQIRISSFIQKMLKLSLLKKNVYSPELEINTGEHTIFILHLFKSKFLSLYSR